MTEQTQDQKQYKLEILFDKNQLMPRLRQQFQNDTFYALIDSVGLKSDEMGIELLAQLALRKRVKPDVLVGLLRHTAREKDVQWIADEIVKAINGELCDYDAERVEIVTNYEIAECVMKELERFQYPLPMIVPPRTLTENRSSGYLRDRSSVILAGQHHDEDVCLDHLNRLNAVRLTLNQDTATMVRNQWKNLDRPKEGETEAKFIKRQKAFEKYERTTLDILGMLDRLGNVIWLTHKYDKRGRTYCQGYHVTYQGTPWNKAIIELAEKEIVQ